MILPSAVQAELTDPDAPSSVRSWISDPPAWLEVYETPSRQFDQASLEGLDDGETTAIALAISLDADLLLMDDRKVASGGADFGVSDPIGMIRDPITAGVVVATVVGRMAAWGVSKKQLEPIRSMDRFASLKTSVYRSPSTQHALLQKAVLDNGGKLEDCVFEHAPGSEMSPLQNNAVDVVWLPEPAATMAERAGASYVFSGPRVLGEFLCTGCYCSKKYAADNPEIVQAVVNAFDSAVQLIHWDHLAALDVVHHEFSHLPATKAELATMRMIDEEVFPENVAVDEDAWQSAVCVWFPGSWQNYSFSDYVDNHFAATSCNRRRR